MRLRIQRWRYVVDWKLQGSLILHGLTYGGMVLLAVGLGIFLPLLWDLSSVGLSGGFEEQAIVMLYLHERFWPLASLCLVIVVLGAIRYSHRVAGPMVRYKRHLRLLANGKLPPSLRTRRNDFMKAEVSCLNEAVLGVSERVDAIRRAQIELDSKLGACVAASGGMTGELTAVVTACAELGRAVGTFQQVPGGVEVEPVAEPVAELVLVGQAESV